MAKLNHLLLILGLVAREVCCAYYRQSYSSSGQRVAHHWLSQASSGTGISRGYQYWYNYPGHRVQGYPAQTYYPARSGRGHRRYKKHSRPRYTRTGSRARRKRHRKTNRLGGNSVNRYQRKKSSKRRPRVTGRKKPARKTRGGPRGAQALLYAVNQERRKRSLPDLKMNSKLNVVAQKQSNYQNANRVVSHSDGNGFDPSTRCKQQGYGVCAENVALGQRSVAEVMHSWMTSQGHRDNILNPQYKDFGAAQAGDAWTQNFGFGKQQPKNTGYYYY
ncbi:hypothetical protein DSO57_1007728 [Entomophthora muscae]|uniref:Uncharacterized protein n=1 Tax=Entomophthora muscae TaxID=34485 RepID=A0ACC2TIH5_9FUNG|nr:hypothetical protein DSO57_1007728 [Entomophthora muscae]